MSGPGGDGMGIGEPRVLARATARVGEGPGWDARLGRIRWVDILAGAIHETDPDSGITSTTPVPTLVAAAAARRSGGLVLATREGYGTLDENGYRARPAVLPAGHRMNDAAVDPRGRYWAGSTEMSFVPGEGRLHVLDSAWRDTVVVENLTLPNGLGWSPDGRRFYLVDTIPGEILVFDVDPDSGLPGLRRVLATIDPGRGMPDGMTVDHAGCLWIALWGGGCLVRLAPDGSELGTVPMPVQQPSSCAFIGRSLDRLVVTSAREGLDLPADAPDGSLFVLDHPPVAGVPAAQFAG